MRLAKMDTYMQCRFCEEPVAISTFPVYRSQRKSESPHRVNMTINENTSTVTEGYCTCKAGISGECSHLLATIMTLQSWILEGYKEVPSQQSCTSLPQVWDRPRGVKIRPEPVSQMIISNPVNINRKRKPLIANFIDNRLKKERTSEDLQYLRNLDNCPISYLAQETSKTVNTMHGLQYIGSGLSHHLSSTVAGGKAQAVAPKPTKSKTDTKKGQTKSSSPDDLTHIAEYLTVLKDAINGDSSESGRHKSAAGYSRAAPSPLGLADLVGQIDLLIKEIETSKENLLQIHDVLVNSKGVKDNKQKPVSLKMGLYQLSSELLQNSISKPQKTPTNMPQGAKQKTIETTDKPPEVGFSHIEKWILWLNDVTQWSEQQILKQEIRDQPEQPESCSGKMWKTSKLIEMEKAIRNSSTHIQKLSLELPAIKENLHATEEIRQRDIEKFQNRLDEMTKTKKDEEAKRRSATRRDVEGLQYQIEQLRTENHRLTADLQEALEQKEYWMKRLSSIAGAKLVDGNPAITDLSDPNRPQKLAERFGELYDNEWTNALEMLPHTNLKEEKDSVVQLVTMLRKAHDHCTSYRENQMQSMTYALFFPIEEDSKINREAGMEDISISVEVRSTMRDLLKKSANQAKKMAFKKFYERLKKTDKKLSRIAEDIITYVDECLDICWMMSLHNPPPCFIWSPQDKKVDPDKFTFFTQSGDVIDYVVWPAMLLHDGGPLLRKGVIQPVKSKK